MLKPFLYLWCFVFILISACASPVPKMPQPDGPKLDTAIPTDELIQNRLKELFCTKARDASEWSNWIPNTRNQTQTRHYAGCYDANDNDPRVRESTYLTDYSRTIPLRSEPPAISKPQTGTCSVFTDYCEGNGTRNVLLYQNVCIKSETTKLWHVETVSFDCATLNGKGGKYTCQEGRCVNLSRVYADLAVKSIDATALSADCNNSFKFEICNMSNVDVKNDFEIKVTANGNTVELTYPAGLQTLFHNTCKPVIEPQKLNILAFGLNLNQSIDVTVAVNPFPTQVNEFNFANNTKTVSVNTGAAWMYNSTVRCTSFCYDSDAVAGAVDTINPIETGTINTTRESYALTGTDHCLNTSKLFEYSCKKAEVINGVVPELFDARIIYCLEAFADLGKPGVCKNGACVEADRYFTCVDLENGPASTTNGAVTYSTPQPAGPNGYDPNQSYPTVTVRDTCKDTNTLYEEMCTTDSPAAHAQLETKCDTPQTPGFVCDAAQGICVSGGTCSCTRKNAAGAVVTTLDPTVLETTTRSCNGNVTTNADRCYVDYDTLFQYQCQANGSSIPVTTVCSAFAPGWGCHAGTCVAPNAALKRCEDTDQQAAPDYTHSGSIKQWDAFGNQRASEVENCDGDIVNEWYCGQNKEAVLSSYNCKNLGPQYTCKNGACALQ